ncbi:MAG: hypothetical protein ABSE16_11385 [Verrucomicrobiota bacterium]|jgi:hypothetical protein
MNNESDKIIMTMAEFLSEAETSELVPDRAADEEQEAKMKDARARRDEEWSVLANQVVGGETALCLGREAASAGEGEVGKAAAGDKPSSDCC